MSTQPSSDLAEARKKCRTELTLQRHPYMEARSALFAALGKLGDREPYDHAAVHFIDHKLTMLDTAINTVIDAVYTGHSSRVEPKLALMAAYTNRRIDSCRYLLKELDIELMPIAGANPIREIYEQAPKRQAEPSAFNDRLTEFGDKWVKDGAAPGVSR